MAIDPKDLSELQKALNEAAGKASVLWTTFITFQLYLAIAFGSVTHRDLFLETPIKLPLLNVDLPLVGFFVVAPNHSARRPAVTARAVRRTSRKTGVHRSGDEEKAT